MEELHAAIAVHLRRQRHVRVMLHRHEEQILGIWGERSVMPRCKICGGVIDDDEGGVYNLADMRQVCECRDHYVPF